MSDKVKMTIAFCVLAAVAAVASCDVLNTRTKTAMQQDAWGKAIAGGKSPISIRCGIMGWPTGDSVCLEEARKP